MNPSLPPLLAPAPRALTAARPNAGFAVGLGLGIVVAFLEAAPDTVAARIPEPDTVLYGRVVERLGNREFHVTSGQLVWTLRTAGPAARTLQLTTRLEKLADGRFSYRLRIPHDALAYDLAVQPGAVGLTAAASRIEHVSVTLDGNPLTFQPGAVDGFAVDQARRAGLQRIDFQTSSSPADTDGDGAPDTWEDAHGYDKYDPADAAPAPTGGSGNTGSTPPHAAAASITTFAQWRAAWFPGASGDLDSFGLADADQDGVSNFLEYAFELDPTRAEGRPGSGWPQAYADAGRAGVSFIPRPGAVDLVYTVESSDDLVNWSASDRDSLVGTVGAGTTVRTVVSTPSSSDSATSRFFRVTVRRQ